MFGEEGARLAQRLCAVHVQSHSQERYLEKLAQVGFVVDNQDTG